jgi:hypothetical protein
MRYPWAALPTKATTITEVRPVYQIGSIAAKHLGRVSAFGAAVLLSVWSSASAQQTSCAASLADFNRLNTGMRYSEIVVIIGCQGSLLSSSDVGGLKTVMYAWSGVGSLGANMNVMLQNDRLIMKSQFGLR